MPFSYQVYNIVAGNSGVTWYLLNSNFWIYLQDSEELCNFWEAFFNASKFDLLSVKLIVEPGSFAANADASSRAIDFDRIPSVVNGNSSDEFALLKAVLDPSTIVHLSKKQVVKVLSVALYGLQD
jgi:hypothetical protein